MSLISLINQHALSAAQSGDWATVASTLNALTKVVKDPTPVTYARIRELFGEETRQLIAASIRAMAKSNSPLAGEMEDLHTVMLNEQIGVRLDLDERQIMLAQIGASAGWDQQLVSQIAALGVRSSSQIEPTTADDCQKEWIVAGCRTSLSALAAKVTNASAWLDALDLSTKTASELQAYCDSLLASQTGNP